MDISVVLCTYNRCGILANALKSIADSVLPEFLEWEVIVVDNNSNDETREVIDSFCSRYPCRFRYVFEPHPGLSNARNAGIREARGDILAFVDDDVTVERTWLQNLTMDLHDCKWSGAGGRILPPVGFLPPSWLAMSGPDAMAGIVCAHFDLGDEPRQLERPPYGANMAFRKEMFDKHGHFRTDLGRHPNSLMGNEDTEFGHRLMSGGECLRYVPSAVVYHEVYQNRLRKEFFLAWWFDFGRARIREIGIRSKLWGIPGHYISLPNNILKILPLSILRWLLTLNSQRRFYYKCRAWATAGKIVEIWHQSLEARTAYDIQIHGAHDDAGLIQRK